MQLVDRQTNRSATIKALSCCEKVAVQLRVYNNSSGFMDEWILIYVCLPTVSCEQGWLLVASGYCKMYLPDHATSHPRR
jgi:hypothetical protein